VTISEFATEHRLKVTRDDCGDPMILGRIYESNIYDYSDTELGVMFITDGKKAPRTGLWNTFKTACVSAGMTPRQTGHAEGAFSFDPANPTQAKTAIRGIRARVRRVMTPEALERLAKTAFLAKKPAVEALIST
jgi:hypothetical protein